MKKTDWPDILAGLDDELLERAVSTYGQRAAPSGVRKEKAMDNKQSGARPRTLSRTMRTVLLAAAVALLLTGSVLAAGRLLNSPEQAWRVAQEEVAQWKALGLLAPEVALNAQADNISEQPAQAGGGYWFGRIWPCRYSIHSRGEKYMLSMDVDTASGKITRLSLEADADASDVPEAGRSFEVNGTTYYYYRNYDDLFPADMTVDRFCTLLAEYWGFSGYTLSGTQDGVYGYNTAAPDGSALLTDYTNGAYLTVYFNGDQSGVPMYVELGQFPGRVYAMIGTNHGVG